MAALLAALTERLTQLRLTLHPPTPLACIGDMLTHAAVPACNALTCSSGATGFRAPVRAALTLSGGSEFRTGFKGVGPHLLMAAQDVPDAAAAGERLVDLHGGAARVCEQGLHALPLQALHQNVRPLAGLRTEAVQPLRRAGARQRRRRRLARRLQLRPQLPPSNHGSAGLACAIHFRFAKQTGRPHKTLKPFASSDRGTPSTAKPW